MRARRVFVSMLLLCLCCAVQTAAAKDARKIFYERYDAFMRQVDRGEVSSETREHAHDLAVRLEKEVISYEARIELLREKVAKSSGEKQDRYLEKALALAAERERKILQAEQKLALLMEGQNVSQSVKKTFQAQGDGGEPASASVAVEKAAVQEKGKKGFSISFEPETFDAPGYD